MEIKNEGNNSSFREYNEDTKANCVIANLAQLATKKEALSHASTWDFLSNLSVTSEEDKKRYKARAEALKARAEELEKEERDSN